MANISFETSDCCMYLLLAGIVGISKKERVGAHNDPSNFMGYRQHPSGF